MKIRLGENILIERNKNRAKIITRWYLLYHLTYILNIIRSLITSESSMSHLHETPRGMKMVMTNPVIPNLIRNLGGVVRLDSSLRWNDK